MGRSDSKKTPSFAGREAASEQARAAARGASRKRGTSCELALRRALWRAGARYRKNVKGLPGNPDIAFLGPRVAVFCDGDFWHGKDWEERRAKLARGNNPGYWIAKIQRNRERDREQTRKLEADGWTVLRYWESTIRADPEAVAADVMRTIEALTGAAAGRKKGVT